MRSRTEGALGVLFVALAVQASGCSDVGDSSAVPGADATVVDDGGLSPDDDSSSPTDGSPLDGGSVTPSDTGAGDGTVSEPIDTGVSTDTGVDGGEEDASISPDAEVPDAGGIDAGTDAGAALDSGPPIDATAPVDAASDGGPPVDAGSDAGAPPIDAGVDAASPLVACTVAGQTGCVQCQFNDGEDGTLPDTNKVCTPTEAALVQHDIAAGIAVTPGPDPDESCYACAAAEGCLDDSEFNDVNHECGDLSAAGASACLDTVACILQTGCGKTVLSACYCGAAPLSGTCASVGASNAANGPCKASEATGLGFAANDGLDILKNFTSTTLAAGVANNIFQCAVSNGCSACVQ